MAYTQLVEKQREFWRSGATRGVEARREALQNLKKLLTEHKKEFDDAIYTDLHRVSTEVENSLGEVDHLLEHLDEYAKPKKVEVTAPFSDKDDSLCIVRESLGVVLVIAPWNFPLICSMPVAPALAAGNTVILKPSEMAPTFSSLIAKLVPQYFDEKLFTVVEGAVQETTDLLKERFDHIMYTGNPVVGKIIMQAAAKHLTPVTLELGGKNPVVILDDADFDDAAKKIVFAKSLNCGQICISADYVLTSESNIPKLTESFQKVYGAMKPLKENPQFARIVNERHFDRLSTLLDRTKGEVLFQADEAADKGNKFLPPRVLKIDDKDALMEGEIFGPILPIIPCDSFDKALRFIVEKEKPLAAYIFTKDLSKAHRFIVETSSGGVSVNDCMGHAFAKGVPFGGVGNSGIGKLGPKHGYDSFSHEKPVLLRNGISNGKCCA